MIFTACCSCDEPLLYPYEAGDEPCGSGVYGLAVCESCGKDNYVERVSIGGQTVASVDGMVPVKSMRGEL